MADKNLAKLVSCDLSSEERAMRQAAFHALLDGRPADQAVLAAVTGLSPARVSVLLERLTAAGRMVIERDSGRVVGSWGLSLVPTDHRLRIRGRDLFTWCAVDAVGIPAGLGEDATVTSRCHRCDTPIRIGLTAGRLTRAEPDGARVWVAADSPGRSIVGFT